MRNDRRRVRQISRVAVTEEGRGDRLLGAAIPSVEKFAVIALEPDLLPAFARDAVVLRIPTDQRVPLRTEKVDQTKRAAAHLQCGERHTAQKDGQRQFSNTGSSTHDLSQFSKTDAVLD